MVCAVPFCTENTKKPWRRFANVSLRRRQLPGQSNQSLLLFIHEQKHSSFINLPPPDAKSNDLNYDSRNLGNLEPGYGSSLATIYRP
jgi:hypothetical protein